MIIEETIESRLTLLRSYETFDIYFVYHEHIDEFDFYYCKRNDPYKMFWVHHPEILFDNL